MKKKFLFVCLLFLLGCNAIIAQTTISTATGTTGYTGTNGVLGASCITFNVNNTNAYAITLDAVETYKSATYPGATATFSLWYSSVSLSGADTIKAPNWTQIITNTAPTTLTVGYNTIFTSLGFNIPAGTEYRFAIQSDNGIGYSGAAAGACSPSILTQDGVDLKLGETQVNSAYVGYAGAFPIPPNNPRWFTGSITFFPTLPCTTPPTAGTATSSLTTGCFGSTFTLGLSGASQGTGLTYQWDSSSNGTTWFPIAGAITKNYTKVQATTSQYRCRVTCSGNTATSTPITVTTPALVSGTFTINSGSATGGTNFQTFADAINYISCGIGGPVVFNVVAGSGPYTEQVAIPNIGGTSATNTIKINGNGEVLTYNSTNTAARAILTLNGVDYLTVDSLVIDATSGTYAWGILITNKSDNNTIKRCTVNSNTTSTSTNYIGLLINGSASALATSGDNGNNNIITNNKFNGGYYAIYLYGNTTSTTQNISNVISNNEITDMYGYAVFASYQSTGLIVRNNDISRPTRTNSGTAAGVYINTGCIGVLVEKIRYTICLMALQQVHQLAMLFM